MCFTSSEETAFVQYIAYALCGVASCLAYLDSFQETFFVTPVRWAPPARRVGSDVHSSGHSAMLSPPRPEQMLDRKCASSCRPPSNSGEAYFVPKALSAP